MIALHPKHDNELQLPSIFVKSVINRNQPCHWQLKGLVEVVVNIIIIKRDMSKIGASKCIQHLLYLIRNHVQDEP